MADLNRLVDVSMKIRGETPHLWDELGMVLREIAAAQAADMVSCSPEYLLKAQGMAAMAQSLATTLVNAPRLYEERLAKVRK
jgi:hypothetical protein